MSPEERIPAVADAMHKVFHPGCEAAAPDEYFRLAKAAIAAADATREVTHAMAKAAYNVHNSASEYCKYSTDLERCKAGIESALKVTE